jgi:hypothetical protein
MSSVSMDRGEALEPDFMNTFDLDNFLFNADSFMPSSSDMSLTPSSLECAMSSNLNAMGGTK